jgi:hypothetical protein
MSTDDDTYPGQATPREYNINCGAYALRRTRQLATRSEGRWIGDEKSEMRKVVK